MLILTLLYASGFPPKPGPGSNEQQAYAKYIAMVVSLYPGYRQVFIDLWHHKTKLARLAISKRHLIQCKKECLLPQQFCSDNLPSTLATSEGIQAWKDAQRNFGFRRLDIHLKDIYANEQLTSQKLKFTKQSLPATLSPANTTQLLATVDRLLQEFSSGLQQNLARKRNALRTDVGQMRVWADNWSIFMSKAVSTTTVGAIFAGVGIPPMQQDIAIQPTMLFTQDLFSLVEGQWLTDDVIYYFLKWICCNTRSNGVIHPVAFEQYKIHNGEQTNFLWPRCNKRGGKANCFFPLNLGSNHWALCYVDLKERKVTFIDSLQGNEPALRQEFQTVVNFTEFYTHITIGSMAMDTRVQQVNGSDCGVHLCLAACKICHVDTQYLSPNQFRRLMAISLLSAVPTFCSWLHKTDDREHRERSEPSSLSCVIELDDGILSDAERMLLNKGLSFIPTRKRYQRFQMVIAIETFKRSMRLRSHFDNIQTDQTDRDLSFPRPSTFLPPKSKYKELEAYLSAVESDIWNSFDPLAKSSNMDEQEWKTLLQLKKRANHEVVIKPADKGAGIVAMKRDTYEDKCRLLLDDTRNYQLLPFDPSAVYQEEINSYLQTAKNSGLISQKVYDSLLTSGSKPARFYGIPKVHKNGTPLRPIAGANGTATERISWYLHQILQPLVENHIPAFLRDTTHFLRWLKSLGNIPETSLFVTMDVVSLYPNIPTDDGLAKTEIFLKQSGQYRGQRLEFLLGLLKLVLTRNNIVFADKHYLQVHGTAMGTRVAPAYANIYMHQLESEILKNCPVKPYAYKRYLDDVFLIWTGTEASLSEFVDFYNTFQTAGTIKVTHTCSTDNFVYLDVSGQKLGNGSLHTLVHHKGISRNSYLHFTSDHPRHLRESIPYSQALRCRKICSTEEAFESEVRSLGDKFVDRGYPKSVVQGAICKARAKSRDSLLCGLTKRGEPINRSRFQIPFARQLPSIPRILKKNYHMLEQNQSTKQLFPSPPMVAYSAAPSLRHVLVRAQLPTNNHKEWSSECFPCKKQGKGRPCNLCSRMLPAQKVKSTTTNVSHWIKGSISCRTENVIYMLFCAKCEKQYVGQTKTALNLRINNHLSRIRNNRQRENDPTSLVIEHF
ncbi:MAG: GIY-YIG nuclease family protein, partial [Gammaproteobacteria bacterium]|nr:GIY-YIG nuclease family protein [Gammaproteobacteria bacterium]